MAYKKIIYLMRPLWRVSTKRLLSGLEYPRFNLRDAYCRVTPGNPPAITTPARRLRIWVAKQPNRLVSNDLNQPKANSRDGL